MKVISFYTQDTPYEKNMEILWESFKKYDIDFCIRGYKDRGSWEENCGIKPEFIKYCLDRFEGEDLLYVDIDAEFVSEPKLEFFKEKKDPLFCFIEWSLKSEKHNIKQKQYELLSGTIYFPNNKVSHNIVDKWIHSQKVNKKKWDQQVLQEILPYCIDNIKILPYEYCHVLPHMESFKDIEPIVKHHQASRTHKKVINQNSN